MKEDIFFILFLISHVLGSPKGEILEKQISAKEGFKSQDIEFINERDHIRLSGSLLLPQTGYSKMAVIVPGAGQSTRNAHYLLALELLKNGIAVFRYDERGVGMSEGEYRFAENNLDPYYAVKKLRALSLIPGLKIGVIGHGKGSFSAMSAYENGCNPDFLVLLSVHIEKGGKIRKHNFKGIGGKITLEKSLSQISVPALFVFGLVDSFCNPEKSAELLSKVPNSRITVIKEEGMNHFLIKGTDKWRKTGDCSQLYEMDQKPLNDIVQWVDRM